MQFLYASVCRMEDPVKLMEIFFLPGRRLTSDCHSNKKVQR